jgi:ATP-dependent Clp protease ATP-binding subunit ClpA
VLLLGPTGTGKTELVKLTASYLYGDAATRRLRRFDLGEYQHADSVLRLLGGPGQTAFLGEAVDALASEGGGILLLDEIEKAHPDLLTLLLSFDEARTTMADGRTRDLSSCYVIMTSNLGAAEASQMIGSGYSAMRRKVIHEAEQVFRKETLARFSATIVMGLLGFEAQERIAEHLLARELELQSRHCHRLVRLADTGVLAFLVGKGFSPDLGARNLRRVIESQVGDALRPFVGDGGGDCGSGELGDLWSRALTLRVQGDTLVAGPLRTRGPSMLG